MTASVSQFDRDFEAAHGELDRFFGKSYVYRHHGTELEVTLALMSHSIQRKNSHGMTESWHGHVFIGTSAELAIDGVLFPPEVGDEIVEEQADGSFQVFSVNMVPGKRCYDYPDPEQVKVVIYAKFIRSEP